MVRFVSLASGSSGNATLITDNKTALLIDCGISGVKLKEKLQKFDIMPNELSGVLITHEHSDHIKGVGVIARKFGLDIYSSLGTMENMSIGKVSECQLHCIKSGDEIDFGSIRAVPFDIPHDAAEPFGYNFFVEDKKYTLATDIGYMPKSLYKKLSGSDSIILESNHDVEMVKYSSYPYYLKQRILSKSGHLSNEATAEIATKLAESGTKHIMLAHLSHENNTPEIAEITTVNALKNAGLNVEIAVANRFETTSFAV